MKMKKVFMLMFLVTALTAGTAHAGDVAKGKALFNDVNLGTNGKSCNSCHTAGKDINSTKKTYTVLGTTQDSLEDAVNVCIKMALSGEPLDKGSDKMKDMVSYLKSLSDTKKRKSVSPGY